VRRCHHVVEFWTRASAHPKAFTAAAVEAEAHGWDGISIMDSQCLAPDPYIGLALAANETSHIGLSTGVTNPVTRHPAVTANCIESIQSLSGGRAVLGIGRGDSSLAHIGFAPAPIAILRDYLELLRGYLRREPVPFDLSFRGERGLRSIDQVGLADPPDHSRIEWIPEQQVLVPLEVFASGPATIQTASLLADQITFAVGADSKRLAWAVDLVRQARAAAGMDPDTVSLGACINLIAHSDRKEAKAIGLASIAAYARLSAMNGTPTGPVTRTQESALRELSANYRMADHIKPDPSYALVLSDEYIDENAILGAPDYCIARLRELVSIGISRFAIRGALGKEDDRIVKMAYKRFAEEVMPAFR
jgi:5,10-methylenetetrahydromethanopterin reductase